MVGHGTLDAAGKAEFFATATQFAAQLPGWLIEPAFLEMASPDLATAVQRVIARGARQVRVLPLLLFAAGHAKSDLPRLLATVAAEHPTVGFALSPVLGCQSDLVALSALRFCEATNCLPAAEPKDTLLMLVGRGSNDSQANAEMLRFAELRGQRTPVGRVETCFLAMCEPNLETALVQAGQAAFRRIVVQPHLLLHGALVDRVAAAVAHAAGQYPNKTWVGVEPLGPHPLLVSAAIEAAGLTAHRL